MAQKARLQGLLDQKLYDELRSRAEEGRRSISREVEYIVQLGLEAAAKNEAN